MGPHLSTGIEGYFSDAARVSWTAKGLLYSSQTLVLDAIVVRLFSRIAVKFDS